MTVIARRIAAIPVRTAVQSWERVVDLVAVPGSDAQTELLEISSIAAMLIADEQTKDDPITITGGGPLVRVYTVHGDEAIEHDDANDSELPFYPTDDDDWKLTLPASGADVAIVEAAIVEASHVAVRDVDAPEPSEERAAAKSTTALELNLTELERP